MSTIIETERLILRTWRASDTEPFYAMNQDPKVMEYFSALLSLEETEALIKRINEHFDQHGFSLYAVELKENHLFIGFIGLLKRDVDFEVSFVPAVEIGWRLAAQYWNRGLATEGAKAVLDYAFKELNLPKIVSFTTEKNVRSRNVMEKLHLHHDPKDDFLHPKLAKDHPLAKHVLYQLTQEEYFKLKNY